MRTRFAVSAVVVAAAAVLTGCGTVKNSLAPECVGIRHRETLVLMAQSVPTASRVPCIANYPAGWHFNDMNIRSGRSDFSLNSDRAGHGALKVTLARKCEVAGATEIPTDEPSTHRFERVVSLDHGFDGVRAYRFHGGCATYRFEFAKPGQALVNEASVAVSFITRGTLAAQVRRDTNGRLTL